MPISKPLRIMSFRLSEEERATLERIAGERHLTFTAVVREGLRLVAEDVGSKGGRGGARARLG